MSSLKPILIVLIATAGIAVPVPDPVAVPVPVAAPDEPDEQVAPPGSPAETFAGVEDLTPGPDGRSDLGDRGPDWLTRLAAWRVRRSSVRAGFAPPRDEPGVSTGPRLSDEPIPLRETPRPQPHGERHQLRLSDQPIPLLETPRMRRPEPLVDLGNPFLSPGMIGEGFTLPTGAVWNPSLLVYGSLQSALQVFDDGEETVSEWANRLDLFANLQLSGTDRLLVGLRPLDRENRFTGYHFEGEPTGWQDEFDGELQTLFYEGEIGDLFPATSRGEGLLGEIGFSVGRQPLLVQDGLLANDDVDMLGLVHNNALPRAGSNLRNTLVFGWNDLHRDDNREGDSPLVFGLLNAYDGPERTLEADLLYIADDEDDAGGIYGGLATIQRVGAYNFTGRALVSQALDEESEAVGDGALLFAEASTTTKGTDNILYLNGFWGVDRFASALRGPDQGGPLGRVGILFAAVGVGRYGAPLSNRPEDAVGAALGYQMFFDDKRQQLILELGSRFGTDSDVEDNAGAVAARFQQALGQHTVLGLEAFGSHHEQRDEGSGARTSLRVEF